MTFMDTAGRELEARIKEEDRSGERCGEVLTALRRIIRAIDLHSKSLARKHGITAPQLVLMREAAAREGVPLGDLARKINLSNATVTEIVNRLEKRGFLTRSRNTFDKRRVAVTLTPMGREVLGAAPSLLQERFVREFGKLQDWEQTSLLSALQRIASMMEIQDLDAPPILDAETIADNPVEML